MTRNIGRMADRLLSVLAPKQSASALCPDCRSERCMIACCALGGGSTWIIRRCWDQQILGCTVEVLYKC